MSVNYGGDNNEVRITVDIEAEDNATPVLNRMQGQVQQYDHSMTAFGETLGRVQMDMKDTSNEARELGGRIRNVTDPTRIASRDLWGMAYALRRLNITVFGNNETMTRLVNTLIALGAAFRVLSVINNISASIGGMTGVIKGLTAVWNVFNASLAQSVFWMGLLTAGAALVAGLTIWGITKSQAPKGSFQRGGIVPSTGPYILHRGEEVKTAQEVENSKVKNLSTGNIKTSIRGKAEPVMNVNSPNYETFNITINTGPVTTKEDVGKIFKEMAVQTQREKQRRGAT